MAAGHDGIQRAVAIRIDRFAQCMNSQLCVEVASSQIERGDLRNGLDAVSPALPLRVALWPNHEVSEAASFIKR